jgi:hypothetical protein
VIILLLLPFERYKIKSLLSKGIIEERFQKNIENKPPFFSFFYSGGKLFKGEIYRDHFVIERIIKYRNSFLPMIEGTIFQDNMGSTIKIVMRLNKFVLAFWIFWMVMIFSIIIKKIPAIISGQEFNDYGVLFFWHLDISYA